MLAVPQTPQALVVTNARFALSRNETPVAQGDVDDVVGGGAVSSVSRQCMSRATSSASADEAFAVEEAEGQVEVVTGRTHGHGERLAVDPDLHRLLDGEGVGTPHDARAGRRR